MPHRTNKDCRKRWSKVCATLKKGPWSSDEDSRLQQGVNRHGCKWTLVAQVVESRSADRTCVLCWVADHLKLTIVQNVQSDGNIVWTLTSTGASGNLRKIDSSWKRFVSMVMIPYPRDD